MTTDDEARDPPAPSEPSERGTDVALGLNPDESDPLAPWRGSWSADVIREMARLDEHSSLESMLAAIDDRVVSAIVVAKVSGGGFQLLAFRPTTDLIAVTAANAREFAVASWQAHGRPRTEAQAIDASAWLALGAEPGPYDGGDDR